MVNSLKISYDEIFRKITIMLQLVGLNIFKKNYTLLEASFIFIDIPTFGCILFYSGWYFRKELVKLAVCVVPSFYGVQGVLKLYIILGKMENMLLINKLIDDFYTFLNEKYPKLVTNLHKKLNICVFIINLFWKIFFICGLTVGILPSIITITTETSLLPFGFILPGMSYEEYPGYEINYIYHLIQIYIVVPSITAFDSLCLLYVYNGCLQVEAIILMLTNLDDMLESFNNNKEAIKIIIIDIIERHQMQRRYMAIIDDTFKLNFLMEVSTEVLQILLVLTVNSWVFWFLGLVFALVGSVQILCICFLGTYIIIMHEKLEQKVYNIKWYNLGLDKQQQILMILLTTQRPINLTIGGMLDLDLNTFVQIYKFIYSFFMMLQNMKKG